MLAMMEVELESLQNGDLPESHGHKVHGMFYKMLHAVNPSLADELHAGKNILFALSTLYKYGDHPGISLQTLAKGQKLYFKIGLLNRDILHAVADAVNKAMAGGSVHIAGIAMEVTGYKVLSTMDITADKHKKASFEGLRSFRIHFHSPTSFRSNGRSLLFPEPKLWLASLYRSWKAAGGQEIPSAFLKRLSVDVYPSRYELSTGLLKMNGYNLSGFTGFCDFEAHESLDAEHRAILCNLLELLPYTGMGYKTTMGMGQTNCIYF